MALEIQQRTHEEVVILDIKGRLTVGPEATQLREQVSALAAAGSKNVILNLAEVNYIDSTGLGALVMCATTLRKAGGDVKLLNLTKRSLELLVITKLATTATRRPPRPGYLICTAPGSAPGCAVPAPPR
jgi:anti-sigma B factor antagonist